MLADREESAQPTEKQAEKKKKKKRKGVEGDSTRITTY